MSKNGNSRKRPAPPQITSPAQAPKHQAASQEDEFVDEDVYLDETLILEEEEILRDIEDRRALACRLAKWVRPPLSDDYVSQSRSIREWLSAYFTCWICYARVSVFLLIVDLFFCCSLSFSAIGDWLCDRGESQRIVAQFFWARRHYPHFRGY